ncbi:hypothetical protein D3C75_795440 [compost metagenome]
MTVIIRQDWSTGSAVRQRCRLAEPCGPFTQRVCLFSRKYRISARINLIAVGREQLAGFGPFMCIRRLFSLLQNTGKLLGNRARVRVL